MGKLFVRPSAIILKDDKILVVKSAYDHEVFYVLPGGGMEPKETILKCVERETYEETRVRIRAIRPLYVNDYLPDRKEQCLNIFILGKLLRDRKPTHKKDPDHDGTVLKAEWIHLKKLMKLDFRPKELIRRIIKDKPGFNSNDNYFAHNQKGFILRQ